MLIITSYNNINFGSIQNPIRPFKVTTKPETLTVSEIDYSKDLTPKFIKKITKFFLDNFSVETNDEFWLRYRKGTLEEKLKHIKLFEKYYSSIFNNEKNKPNLTLLLATDKKGNIQGACLTYGNHEIPGTFDSTLYVDSMATNKKYRGQKLAQSMLEASLSANKNTYTDVYLTSANAANPFYEKMGFVKLNPNSLKEKRVLDYIERTRRDYPEHITPYYKPLQLEKPRWYETYVE